MTGEARHTSRRVQEALRGGVRGVLATVVRTEGSTYRKTGATMFVPHAGDPIGLLSGGCLEDLIANAAREVDRRRDPKVVHFDLMHEGEYLVGYGKGCFGKLWILLEPVPNVLLSRQADEEAERSFALIYETEGDVPVRPGQRVVLEGARVQADLEPQAAVVQAALMTELQGFKTGAKPYAAAMRVGGGLVRYCIHATRPPVDLVVFGAGPDAKPLVALAGELGWRVRVFDHRPAHVMASRFPGADLVELYHPSSLASQLAAREHSAAVLMTHNLLVDAEILRWAARTPALRYVGVLGPTSRTARIHEHWGEDAPALKEALAGRLRSPIGLALGGAGEADIALAIVAEIQAWWSGTSARPMSEEYP